MKFILILLVSLIPRLGCSAEAGSKGPEEVPYYDGYQDFFPLLASAAKHNRFETFVEAMSSELGHNLVMSPIYRGDKHTGVRAILPGPRKNYWVAVHIEDSMYEVEYPVSRPKKRRRTARKEPARHRALPFFSETFPQVEGSKSLYLKMFYIPRGIAVTMDSCVDQSALLVLRIDELPEQRRSETVKIAAKDIIDESGEPYRITGRDIMKHWQLPFLKAFSVSADYLHDDADLGSLSILTTYKDLKFKLRYLAALVDEPTYYEKFGYRIARLLYQDTIQDLVGCPPTTPIVQIPEIYRIARRHISQFTFEEVFELHQKLSPAYLSEAAKGELATIKSFLMDQGFRPQSTMQEIFTALKAKAHVDKKIHQKMLQVYSYCVADIVAISLAPTPEQERCPLSSEEEAYIAAWDIIDNSKYLVRTNEDDDLNPDLCSSSFPRLLKIMRDFLQWRQDSPKAEQDEIDQHLLGGKTDREIEQIKDHFRRPTQKLVTSEAWIHFLTLHYFDNRESSPVPAG